MTTINKNGMVAAQNFNGQPFGNVWEGKFHFETSAGGIVIQDGASASDLATAPQIGDVVRIGILPAGLELQDMLSIISAAFAALTTMSIGFQYVDGVDVPAAPQDAAYFASALATSATGVSRKTGIKAPLTLAKDAYLTLTLGGAAESAAGVHDIIVYGRNTGGF